MTVPQVYPGTSLIIADSIGTPVCAADLRGEAEEPQQFLGAAKARELVEIHAIERDLSLLHGVEELGSLSCVETVEIEIGCPEDFDVPDEPRPLGIVRRPAGGSDSLQQVVHLLLLDPGLDLGIANVRVRVGQNVDRKLALGLESEGARGEHLAAGLDRDGKIQVLVDIGQLDLGSPGPWRKRQVDRRLGPEPQPPLSRGAQVQDGQACGLVELAVLAS